MLDFDAMQMRLHPAESRVRKLSAEIPARFVAFDVLSGTESRWQTPLAERRSSREALPLRRFAGHARPRRGARVARTVRGGLRRRRRQAARPAYLPGLAGGVVKVKRIKTADCVVVGLRWKENRERIATLLLGLYADDGELDYVGSTAVAPSAARRIAELLMPLLEGRARARLLRAEPLGQRRARRGRSSAGAGGRGALRQVAGHALPPRHEASCASGPTRIRRSAPGRRCGRDRAARSDGRQPAARLGSRRASGGARACLPPSRGEPAVSRHASGRPVAAF